MVLPAWPFSTSKVAPLAMVTADPPVIALPPAPSCRVPALDGGSSGVGARAGDGERAAASLGEAAGAGNAAGKRRAAVVAASGERAGPEGDRAAAGAGGDGTHGVGVIVERECAGIGNGDGSGVGQGIGDAELEGAPGDVGGSGVSVDAAAEGEGGGARLGEAAGAGDQAVDRQRRGGVEGAARRPERDAAVGGERSGAGVEQGAAVERELIGGDRARRGAEIAFLRRWRPRRPRHR
jgi:hypothetical protein